MVGADGLNDSGALGQIPEFFEKLWFSLWMNDWTRIFESDASDWGSEQVVWMATVFLEGFTWQVSKILEILEILEFPENMSYVW